MTHTRTVNRGTALKALGIAAMLSLLFLLIGNARVQAVSSTLVINEIDYDQEGTDTAEFLELKNVSSNPINLDLYSVVFWNATSTGSSYRTLDLPDVELAAGDYYVICGGTVANCDLDNATNTDFIQNGAPDALGLWLGATLIDAVSYEGNSQAPYTEGSGTGLVDTAAIGAIESISRCADGSDTDQNNVDFALVASTPGTANNCPVGIVVINEFDYDQDSTDTAEFLELKNVGTAPVNLDNFTLELVNGSGGGAVVYDTIDLPNVNLAVDDYFVICANAATVANCDLDDGPDTNFIQNGDPDAIGLKQNGALVDAVSYGGNTGAPYTEGSGIGLDDNPSLTATGLSRCPDGTDTNQNNVDFVAAAITPGTANCVVMEIAPTVVSTNPADNAIDVAANTNITITFSEPVDIAGTIAVVGGVSGAQNLTPTTSDNVTFTLDPADFAVGETVTVTILASQVTDQDTEDGPDNMTADYVIDFTIIVPQCGQPATLISAVQGTGATSPLDGSTVTIEAVVVGDFQDYTADPPNELSGYALQEEDADADGDVNTSEGIFVFDGQNPAVNVAVGDKVRVTGTVDEFGDAPDTITELVGPLTIELCSTGNALPTPATINLPVSSLADYEKYENMAVIFPQELTVTEIFTLGRYGEVLLAAGGRLENPTDAAEPGAPAQAVRDANILRSIVLDDGLTNQNPDPIRYPDPTGLTALNTLRGGDTTTGLTGILYYFDATEDFRVQPTGAIAWDHDNPRPAAPPAMEGSLLVAGANVLNYFTTIDAGPDVCGPLENQDCRGADSSLEFTRQRDKIINMLVAIDADVVGLNELENNADASPAGDGVDPVLEDIVAGMNAIAGAGTYGFIDTGVLGGDAIKVALIYKTTTVTPVGNFAVLDSSVDPRFDTTKSRPALAQTFEEIATGEKLTVVVNHLKSKGSACGPGDDVPDVEGGNCNGTRVLAAEALVDWLATKPTGTTDPDVLIIGDLNSYAKEDPIDVLVAAGYTDLAAAFNVDPYSYVFDGEWGYLDYGMSNATLTPQVVSATEWHINSDEPIVLDYNTDFKTAAQITYLYDPAAFRASDHDPMLVGMNLDSVAPDTTIDTSPTDPSNSADATFTFSANEAGSTFECQIDGLGWESCTSPKEYTGLTDGSHTFEVRATDAIGNVDPTPASYTWVIDTMAPDTTITAFPPNPSSSPDASFSFTGNDGSGTGVASFECQIDGLGWESCTSPKEYAGLTDGSHTFEVRAIDAAGNTDPSPASYTWVINTTVYDFSGFFGSVKNPPFVNKAKAGSAVPLIFSLGNDFGLDIFADGYPASREIDCQTQAPLGDYSLVNSNGFSYNEYRDRYTFVWKTEKSWKGTCRELNITFDDGTVVTAFFRFK